MTIKKGRASVRMPPKMLKDIGIALERSGHNLKERSNWICKAISQLASTEDYWLYVQEEWIERGSNTMIQVTMDEVTNNDIEKMQGKIKEINPEIVASDIDIISAIIRTSIIQRFIKDKVREK